MTRFERATSRSQNECSTRLSYTPIVWWMLKDLNLRACYRSALQAAAFAHSAKHPLIFRTMTTHQCKSIHTVDDQEPDTPLAHAPQHAKFSTSSVLSWMGTGAGDGNRTRVFSLEGCGSTIELHPQSWTSRTH